MATRLETLHAPRLAYALGRPRSTIYGVLRREHDSRFSFIDRPTRTVVRCERARLGELSTSTSRNWAGSDKVGAGRCMALNGQNRRDGPDLAGYDFIHVAVDDNSRVAFVKLSPKKRRPRAPSSRDPTAYFASEGVTIERVMTDNARNYTPSKIFGCTLVELGITHKRTRSTDPRRTGRRSASTAPSSRSLPTSPSSLPTTSASRHSSLRWPPTMMKDPTRPSGAHPSTAPPSTTLAGITSSPRVHPKP